MKPNKKKKFIAVEAFCGPGGMSLGLENAGFDVRFAFDIDEKSVDTFNRNHLPVAHCLDAKAITGNLIKKMGKIEGEIDLFSGGPPCQGFSKQKRGAHLGDDRNKLVIEYARLVKELKPKFFLMENVAMLGQKRGREFVEQVERMLSAYELTPHFYNSADYGLAQTRQRFVIVGKLRSIKSKFSIPSPTHLNRYKTVGEAIGDLPEPPMDYSEHPIFANHQRAKVTPINIKRFSYVPQGGGWQDIPQRLRIDAHKNVDTSSGGWPDVYGRLKLNGQAPTITGGFDSFTRGRFGHPIQDRPLTPREAARLQGFPDWYVFEGNRGDVRSQIGNAVPPPLAEMIARQIIKCLSENDSIKAKKSPRVGSRQLDMDL